MIYHINDLDDGQFELVEVRQTVVAARMHRSASLVSAVLANKYAVVECPRFNRGGKSHG